MGKAAYKKVVEVSSSSDGSYNELPMTDASLAVEGDVLDDTDLTSEGTRSRIIGLKDWNVSGTMNFSTGDGFQLIKDSYDARSDIYVRYLPLGSSLSSLGYQGAAKVENYNLSGGVADLEQVDISLPATDALNSAT